MALTPTKSSQYTDFTALPGVSVHGAEWDAKPRYAVGKMTYTAVGQGVAKMVRLGPGRKLILKGASRVVAPAGTAGALINVGHTAYTTPAGAAVAADNDAFVAALANTAAVDAQFSVTATTIPYMVLDSKEGVDIEFEITTQNSPAAGDVYIIVAYLTAR